MTFKKKILRYNKYEQRGLIMSTNYQKNNKGTFFLNEKTKPSQPDFAGNCIVDGVEKRIAIWKNKNSNGIEFYSITFSEPFKNQNQTQDQKQQSPTTPSNSPSVNNNDVNDIGTILSDDLDIPF